MTTNIPKSLTGKTVIITRSQEQSSELSALLEKTGAKVLDMPALVIGDPNSWEPLDQALIELESFHWLIFSSANGVNAVEKRLNIIGKSLSKAPRTLKIAAIGKKTAQILDNLDTKVAFIPPKFVAESLIENFPISGLGLKILLPRVQSGGRTILAKAFKEAGSEVVEVPAYESYCPENIPETTSQAISDRNVDAIAFTSSKTAAHTAKLLNLKFGESWKEKLLKIKIISIGPQTTKSCHQYFDKVDQEANPHDIHGLINACISALSI